MHNLENFVCSTCGQSNTNETIARIKKYKVPFINKCCGSINFSYHAILDKVFVYPSMPPETISSIIVPERFRHNYINEYGVVLSVGRGWYDRYGRFHAPNLKVGDVITYDKDCLRSFYVDRHEVKIVGYLDIKGVIR